MEEPDGMGYRLCLDFSKEYRAASPAVVPDRRKYLMVVVSGGLNQQRNQIVDAVVIARILGAALVVPVLQVNVIWGDESEFADIFDLEHFKKVLGDDVRVVNSSKNTAELAGTLTHLQRSPSLVPVLHSSSLYSQSRCPKNGSPVPTAHYLFDAMPKRTNSPPNPPLPQHQPPELPPSSSLRSTYNRASRTTIACKAGDDDAALLMTDEEREEWRLKIRGLIDANPDVEEETDPDLKRTKMQKLLAEYPLVVEEEDPDWPEDAADGWGFNFDQFFNKVMIKKVNKEGAEDEDGYDSGKEVVLQDDDYIRPIRDVTARDWEDTVFKDFNPLVILVHNRYKRPRKNEKARVELERAVQNFWDAGMPSPRCVAVDAVVEDEIVSALRVSAFLEILFTKAGKILHRDKVVRGA